MASRIQFPTPKIIRRLEKLFGFACFSKAVSGLCHVTAVLDDVNSASLHTINVNKHAPKCNTDFDILMCARAASDGVIQAAASVRDEHAAFGGGASSLHLVGPHAATLARWRDQSLGLSLSSSHCIVLSHTGNVPGAALLHNPPSEVCKPTFTPWLMVDTAAQDTAAGSLQSARIPREQVLASDFPSIRAAAAYLHQKGVRRISVEAGPTTTRCLYDGSHAWHAPAGAAFTASNVQHVASFLDCPVDWLFLSAFRPSPHYTLHASTKGAASIAKAELKKHFTLAGQQFQETTEDGTWLFSLFKNKRLGDSTSVQPGAPTSLRTLQA